MWEKCHHRSWKTRDLCWVLIWKLLQNAKLWFRRTKEYLGTCEKWDKSFSQKNKIKISKGCSSKFIYMQILRKKYSFNSACAYCTIHFILSANSDLFSLLLFNPLAPRYCCSYSTLYILSFFHIHSFSFRKKKMYWEFYINVTFLCLFLYYCLSV